MSEFGKDIPRIARRELFSAVCKSRPCREKSHPLRATLDQNAGEITGDLNADDDRFSSCQFYLGLFRVSRLQIETELRGPNRLHQPVQFVIRQVHLVPPFATL